MRPKAFLLAATVLCMMPTMLNTGYAKPLDDTIIPIGGQLPAKVLAEAHAKIAQSKKKTHYAVDQTQAAPEKSETQDTFPLPKDAKPDKDAASQPVNTPLKDSDGSPYYYDQNHEFHPGTPPKQSVDAGKDVFDHNNDLVMADDTHDQGSIGNGSANGHPSDVPLGANGQPLQVYYGDDSKEDKKAELDEALKNLLPPVEGINAVRHRQADVRKADAEPIQNFKPVIRSISLTLAPGEVPPVIHCAYGVTTSITFSDIAGNPWFVNSAHSDTSSYTTVSSSGNDEDKTNIVTIAPTKEYSQGRNLTVLLEHSAMPVIFQLETGNSNSVDYRLDTSIRQRGPLTKPDFVEEGIPATNDSMLQDIIDGIPPKKSVKLKTSNPGVEAWRVDHMMYIRTKMQLKGPKYTKRSQNNINGILAYGLQYTPDITMSNDGELITVRIGK